MAVIHLTTLNVVGIIRAGADSELSAKLFALCSGYANTVGGERAKSAGAVAIEASAGRGSEERKEDERGQMHVSLYNQDCQGRIKRYQASRKALDVESVECQGESSLDILQSMSTSSKIGRTLHHNCGEKEDLNMRTRIVAGTGYKRQPF